MKVSESRAVLVRVLPRVVVARCSCLYLPPAEGCFVSSVPPQRGGVTKSSKQCTHRILPATVQGRLPTDFLTQLEPLLVDGVLSVRDQVLQWLIVRGDEARMELIKLLLRPGEVRHYESSFGDFVKLLIR